MGRGGYGAGRVWGGTGRSEASGAQCSSWPTGKFTKGKTGRKPSSCQLISPICRPRRPWLRFQSPICRPCPWSALFASPDLRTVQRAEDLVAEADLQTVGRARVGEEAEVQAADLVLGAIEEREGACPRSAWGRRRAALRRARRPAGWARPRRGRGRSSHSSWPVRSSPRGAAARLRRRGSRCDSGFGQASGWVSWRLAVGSALCIERVRRLRFAALNDAARGDAIHARRAQPRAVDPI